MRLVIRFVAAIALALWPAVVLSQNESGQLTIAVVDASTAQQVALARVLLDGPIMTSELTTQSGKVIFRDAQQSSPSDIPICRQGD